MFVPPPPPPHIYIGILLRRHSQISTMNINLTTNISKLNLWSSVYCHTLSRMKWEQSGRDNNSDFILLWRYSTQTMTRTRVNCSLVHLTTTEEELCLFSHLEAARPPVGTPNCIMCNTWLLYIGNHHCPTFPVLMRADTWAQELASYRMPDN